MAARSAYITNEVSSVFAKKKIHKEVAGGRGPRGQNLYLYSVPEETLKRNC